MARSAAVLGTRRAGWSSGSRTELFTDGFSTLLVASEVSGAQAVRQHRAGGDPALAAEQGAYVLAVGRSSADLPATAKVRLD